MHTLRTQVANEFAGVPYTVVRPNTVTRKRTWRERLFSRPWQPLKATETTTVRSAVASDECIFFQGRHWMGEGFYSELKKAQAEAKLTAASRGGQTSDG